MKAAENKLTKIEISIVIIMVGTLVFIAIPACQDYCVRTAVSDAFSCAAAAKAAVAQTVRTKNILPSNQHITGYISPPPSISVSSVKISEDGSATITVMTTPLAGGGTITFVPSFNSKHQLEWDCTGGNLADKYRPLECR